MGCGRSKANDIIRKRTLHQLTIKPQDFIKEKQGSVSEEYSLGDELGFGFNARVVKATHLQSDA
jgi:hypothetical protein